MAKDTRKSPPVVRTAVTRAGLWKPTFIATLAKLGNVSLAAQAAGVHRNVAYEARDRDSQFADDWKDAIEQAADALEAEARRRAVDGVEEIETSQGMVTMIGVTADGRACPPDSPEAVATVPKIVRRYSDTLLIFLLKAARPQKFRDNVNVTGEAFREEPLVYERVVPAPKALPEKPQ